MNARRKLRHLYRGFEALYETRTGIDPVSLLVPMRFADGRREMLVTRETDGVLEVALAIGEETLDSLGAMPVDVALGDHGLGHTLPILEGLSHLVYVAEAARTERPVSGLELETQAEVDKLAICLLHRWPQARRDFPRLVDRLYHRFELLPGRTELRERYELANRLARGFSRRLAPHIESQRLGRFRTSLRRFWRAPMRQKIQLAGC